MGDWCWLVTLSLLVSVATTTLHLFVGWLVWTGYITFVGFSSYYYSASLCWMTGVDWVHTYVGFIADGRGCFVSHCSLIRFTGSKAWQVLLPPLTLAWAQPHKAQASWHSSHQHTHSSYKHTLPRSRGSLIIDQVGICSNLYSLCPIYLQSVNFSQFSITDLEVTSVVLGLYMLLKLVVPPSVHLALAS